MSRLFRHVEPGRTIVFGPGALAASTDLLGAGYTLLSTARALASQPDLARGAARTFEVPAGPVDEVAARLRATVKGERVVAFGGGRVIDVAKALAAADPPRDVIAIPTSLSGAEMTGVHKHASGVDPRTPRVRAAVVINDPELSASQPTTDLAASTGNALAHAVTAIYSNRATPFSAAVGREAVARLERSWASTEVDTEEVALGALLCGWAVDHSGLGPHHALAQTAVATGHIPHAQANAALLPQTIAALRTRRTDAPPELTAAERLASRLQATASATLAPLVEDDATLHTAVATAADRPEMTRFDPPLTADEIEAIYRAAGRGSAQQSIRGI